VGGSDQHEGEKQLGIHGGLLSDGYRTNPMNFAAISAYLFRRTCRFVGKIIA
jgi:hypothetical protein